MNESSLMDSSMTKVVKNMIAGAYKYKNSKEDRTAYITDCLMESFPTIRWGVIIFDNGHGYVDFKNFETNYCYWCELDGAFNIIMGFKQN